VVTRFLLTLVMLNGISLVFWGCVGLCRLLHEQARRAGHGRTARALATRATARVGAPGALVARRRARHAAAAGRADGPVAGRITSDEVAVLIPAHNEEKTLGLSLDAVSELVTVRNVFVASDGSTDRTVGIAREWGCQVLDIQPNGGKARALRAAIEHFRIYDRYAAVLILDADSQPDPDYLEHALPLFDDPDVVAVAGHALPAWHSHWRPSVAMYIAAYRMRLYRVTQLLLRYGQTWKHSNVSFIVPGFASMYRCSVLSHIDIDAPGLIIEDFNMTFELHHKRLGKIAYTPRVRCTSHEPLCFADYVKQVRRWHLGFWQTIRRHGFWPGFFWLSLAAFVIEMLLQSLSFLTVPFVLAGFVIAPGEPMTIWLPHLGLARLTVTDVVLGVFLTDYTITALTAAVERKPILMLYGLGFALLRWIDSFLFLYTLPLAFAEKSDGRWVSPKRV
jgi:biofilm PGA synthesis N-glycosyltransferase PgaC